MNIDKNSNQASPELPSGTVTFLFTDIEGSTELLKHLGEEYKSLLLDQRRILREVFSHWEGKEVDTQGDAFFVSFSRATQAVNASIEVQRKLTEYSWPEGVEVRVRMGLHTGEPWRAEEGYVGMDVHRAARIAHVGHGGQVLLSETTTALILDDLPEGVSLHDLGRHLLKDLTRPEHIRQLVVGGMPSDFPPLTSLEKLPSQKTREPRSVGECPYQGLAAFREEHADFFFGREEFTDQLIAAVKTHPLIAVIVGSSGSGKSSTVFAGLLPQLRKERGWSVVQLRPGSQPLISLMSVLLPLIDQDLQVTERLVETRKLTDAIRSGDLPLNDIVNQVFEKNSSVDHLLLVVDQFEELYTLCLDEAERGLFKDELLDVVLTTSGGRQRQVVLLLTLRADFMGQALTHRPFADALQESSLLMGPMTREELRSAVQKPAEIQGAVFEAGLVERILDDVGEKPGNLPLLEFALTLLWEAQDDGWLTHTDYESIGCVDGALARYADEVFDNLDESDQERARRVFVQLVKPGEGTEDTRRVATRSDLSEEDWGLVQHLADRRLVVTGRDADGNETVEVVHEALIQRWGQFQRWMEEDRNFRSWQERLRSSLRIWESSDRNSQALLRGLPLDEAEVWQVERWSELSATDATYIQASLIEREQRRKEEETRQVREARLVRTRRTLTRGLLGVLSIGLLISIGLAIYSFTQSKRAQSAEQEALRLASIGLAAQAMSELEGTSPERAVLLALEALEHYPYTPQAESALAQAVLKGSITFTIGELTPLQTTAVSWSPDGKNVAIGFDGYTQIWDVSDSKERMLYQSPSFHKSCTVTDIDWSETGDNILLVIGSWFLDVVEETRCVNPLVEVWPKDLSSPIMVINSFEGEPTAATWSADESRILIANSEGTAGIWNVETGDYEIEFEGHTDAITDAIWSHDDQLILTVSWDGTARLWDRASGKEVLRTPVLPVRLTNVAWAPGSQYFGVTGDDGTVRIWDIESGEIDQILIGHDDAVHDIVWSPDGSLIATGGSDGTVRVWDAITGLQLYRFISGRDIKSISWSNDGRKLVASGTTPLVGWKIPSRNIIRLIGHKDWSLDIQWSPDGEKIATNATDVTSRIWDPRDGKELHSFYPTAGLFLAWSPNGDKIITTGGWSEQTEIWDVDQKALDYSKQNAEDWFYHSADWSPDGSRIVASRFPYFSFEVWDSVTGEEIISAELLDCFPHYPTWSPDGKWFVTGCQYTPTEDDNTPAQIWDGEMGTLVHTLESTDGETTKGVWSPDGKYLGVAYEKGVVKIWDMDSYEVVTTFAAHSGLVWDLAWSPNGQRIASSDSFGNVIIWDMKTGDEVMSFTAESAVMIVSWSPKGDQLAAAGQFFDPIIMRVWETTEDLIAEAYECCVVRELTQEEREQFGLQSVETLDN